MLGRLRDHRPHIPQPQAGATTIFPLLLPPPLLLLLPLPLPLSVPLPGPSYTPQPSSTHECTMTVLGQCRPRLSHQSLQGTGVTSSLHSSLHRRRVAHQSVPGFLRTKVRDDGEEPWASVGQWPNHTPQWR